MKKQGLLYLVSVGPGSNDLIPPLAERALRQSEAIVSYDLYLRWIQDWIQGKEIQCLPLTREKERASLAVEHARNGRIVSLVSSGDVGVYGMASLAFEMMRDADEFEVQVIPGISAANSCASLLGSPLSHDFATLSLSDLLCPWEWIEQRAQHLARADLVTVFYNVQSRQRRDGVYKILKIFAEHKRPETWCGIVSNAYRDDQKSECCALKDLAQKEFDMFTTLVIGNRFTTRKGRFLYTPRGYHDWSIEGEQSPSSVEAKGPRVWVFSGTSDGNALANRIAQDGFPVVVSAASDYGGEIASASCPGVAVHSGRMGVEARRRVLKESRAIALVDATHPFASEISWQLIGLSKDLNIPYLRYERPPILCKHPLTRCPDMAAAAREAISVGKRIFLATGAKDLSPFLKADGTGSRQWFARVLPDSHSMDSALRAGLPRSHILAMQGPFSREFNEALWKGWQIDCVVTKNSGTAGGLEAKLEAAHVLGIPVILIDCPKVDYPRFLTDFDAVLQCLRGFPRERESAIATSA